MYYSVESCSLIGGRANNEDNFLMNRTKFPEELGNKVVIKEEKELSDTCIYAVCDGMGGEDHGQDASLTAVYELFEYAISNCESPPGQELWQRMNDRVLESGGGTTVSLAVLYKDDADEIKVEFQSVGDSFIYYFNAETQTLQLVNQRDNVASLYARQGLQLTDLEKRQYESQLLDYIGKSNRDSNFHKYEQTIHSDDIIIIASDGISPLSHDQIEKILFGRSENTAFELAKAAIGNNVAADNTTVIVLRFSEEADINKEKENDDTQKRTSEHPQRQIWRKIHFGPRKRS